MSTLGASQTAWRVSARQLAAIFVLLLMLASVFGVIGPVLPADATQPYVTADVVCTNGVVMINWTARSWLQTGGPGSGNPNIVIRFDSVPVASGAFTAENGYQFSGSNPWPNPNVDPQNEVHVLAIAIAPFDNGNGQDTSNRTTVTLPEECNTTTTSSTSTSTSTSTTTSTTQPSTTTGPTTPPTNQTTPPPPPNQASFLVSSGCDANGDFVVNYSTNNASVVLTPSVASGAAVTLPAGTPINWAATPNSGAAFPAGTTISGQVVVASCENQAEVLGIQVSAPEAAQVNQVTQETLPFTGVSTESMALLAAAFAGVGLLLLLAARQNDEKSPVRSWT